MSPKAVSTDNNSLSKIINNFLVHFQFNFISNLTNVLRLVINDMGIVRIDCVLEEIPQETVEGG